MPTPADTAESKVKTVRALERGLDVLIEIQQRRGCSLAELHHTLKLPKATLLRMLTTLAGRGLVWHRLADGAYMPSTQRVAFSNAHLHDRLAEVSSPCLKRLSNQVHWPSVIAVPRLDYMEIIETNSPLIRIDAVMLGPVGVKLSYLHTATGRAYLASCDQREREAIIERRRPADANPEDEAALDTIIRTIKLQGYSTREPKHPWPDRVQSSRPGRQSIAMAIRAQGQAIAAINLTWPKQRAAIDQVTTRCLPALRATAKEIGSLMEAVMG